MNEPRIKTIFAFSIPYFALCGGIWEYFYWSTFDSRILQNINSSDLIKVFIFPFIAASAFYLLGHLLSVIFITNILPKQPVSHTITKKQLTIRRILILSYLILCFILALLSKNNYKWVTISVTIGMGLSIWVNYIEAFSILFPDRRHRYSFIITVILIPCLCFGFAKKTSLDIFYKKNPDVKLEFKQPELIKDSLNQFKLVGFLGDRIYVQKISDNLIISFPGADIFKIEYLKNAP